MHSHCEQFVAGVAESMTCHLIHIYEFGIFPHPVGGIAGMIHGKLGEAECFFPLHTLGNIDE